MYRHWVAAAVLVVALPTLLAAQAAPAQGHAAYDSLRARLAAGDTLIDYQALRFAYAESPGYDPYGSLSGDTRERMLNAYFRQGDAAAARQAADSLLVTTYVDIDAHMIAALTSASLGDTARSRFHASVARGLTASIEQPGTGTSPDAPYELISVAEIDALLRMRGWRLEEQTTATCGSAPCERLEVSRPSTGEKQTLYLDLSRARAYLERQTSP